MILCAQEHPAVRGLFCEKPEGHRDFHNRRVRLKSGLVVLTEWRLYHPEKKPPDLTKS